MFSEFVQNKQTQQFWHEEKRERFISQHFKRYAMHSTEKETPESTTAASVSSKPLSDCIEVVFVLSNFQIS